MTTLQSNQRPDKNLRSVYDLMHVPLPAFDDNMSDRTDVSAATAGNGAANVRIRLERTIADLLHPNSTTSADIVWSTINAHIRRRCIRRTAIAVLLLASVAATVIYVPAVNSFALAVARIVLIRGVLPVWDWQHLDRDLCLWPKVLPTIESDSNGASEDIDVDGCDHCERIGNGFYEQLRIIKQSTTCTIKYSQIESCNCPIRPTTQTLSISFVSTNRLSLVPLQIGSGQQIRLLPENPMNSSSLMTRAG